jgi:hypothetical protein
MREFIERLFPRLQQTSFEITSPRDGTYNCVAWAAGDVQRWWWPGDAMFTYWQLGVIREQSISSFVIAFSTLGYEASASAGYEPQFEKVAIFASPDGTPTHMARQLADGSWTSKLGSLEDWS